jgi:hypothetical protein
MEPHSQISRTEETNLGSISSTHVPGKGKKSNREEDFLISWNQFGSPDPPVSGSTKQVSITNLSTT